MNRVKSFTAGILSIIFNIGGMILNFLGAIAMLFVTLMVSGVITGISDETGSSAPYMTSVAGIVLLSLLIVFLFVMSVGHLIALVLSIVSLTASKKPPEVYAKRKKVIITTVVFNFLVLIPSVVMGFAFFASIVGFLWLAVGGVLIAANVLWIMDISQEKTRIAQMNDSQPAESVAQKPAKEEVVVEVKAEESKPVEQPAPVAETSEKVEEISEQSEAKTETEPESEKKEA